MAIPPKRTPPSTTPTPAPVQATASAKQLPPTVIVQPNKDWENMWAGMRMKPPVIPKLTADQAAHPDVLQAANNLHYAITTLNTVISKITTK